MRAWKNLMKFVTNFKNKLLVKQNPKHIIKFENLFVLAHEFLIRAEQRKHFSHLLNYFSGNSSVASMPDVVSQLNLYLNDRGILCVRGKFQQSPTADQQWPVLLPRSGELVRLIVNDCHERMMHAGCYSVIGQMKKHYDVPKIFMTIKNILQNCVQCRKQNARSIKINQSYYRDFRVNPSSIPYKNIFIDHLGPFMVKQGSTKVKVYILCIILVYGVEQ